MERPTSDKILFINSDILIHLMPSKCGILNLGISHGISHSFLQRAQPRNMSQALTGSQYFPNTLPTYLGVLCGCVVCGCLFVWLCGSWLCVWWHHCGRAIVLHCVPAPCVAATPDNRGAELLSPTLIRPHRRLTAGHWSAAAAIGKNCRWEGGKSVRRERDKLWQLQLGSTVSTIPS